MSITAYKIEAVGHDRTGKDFGYVNIMYRYSQAGGAAPRRSGFRCSHPAQRIHQADAIGDRGFSE